MKHLLLILALLVIAPAITCTAQADTIPVASVPALSDAQLYALGLQDGRNDWNKRAPGIGALGCGIFPILGMYIVPVIAFSKPRPSVEDMLSDKPFNSPLYLMGWRKAAHKKKAKRVWGNFVIGVGFTIATVSLIYVVSSGI